MSDEEAQHWAQIQAEAEEAEAAYAAQAEAEQEMERQQAMTKEQSEAEKAAEEWTETREGLVELPYSRKTICTAMVKEQIAAFLAGAAWAAPKWVRCSDDLPGDEEVLIVWKGIVCTGWYMEAGEEVGAYWDISGRAMPVTNLEEVTHWMSKPAAPEVEK